MAKKDKKKKKDKLKEVTETMDHAPDTHEVSEETAKKLKNKKSKKQKGLEQVGTIHEHGPDDGATGGGAEKSDVPRFDGTYAEFNKLKNELPAIPNGSDPTFQDHFFDTNFGQLRVRINQDTDAGKAGRRNTQLDGKLITAVQLRALLNGQTTPPPKDKEEDEGEVPGTSPLAPLFDATYKRKDLKIQLDLMGIGYSKKEIKSLEKKITGVQVQTFMMQTLDCDSKTVGLCLEALSR